MHGDRRVAVLGGGQLGRMLGLAGIPLGCSFRFLDPAAGAPAGAVGDLVVGDLGDEDALTEVARDADVVTYEWEGVPAGAARFLAQRLPVRPGARSLEISQDRLAEKELFGVLGIPTAEYRAVDDRAALDRAIAELGCPAVLKTRRGGYDGKGQTVLRDAAEVEGAWAAVGGVPLLLESFVAFSRELSVLATRGHDGDVACWPVVENRHADGILRVTRAPATGLDADLQRRAEARIAAVLEATEHVGTLCIEWFEVGGDLWANEFAPRVHNSGHWTIEGAVTSQFENHLRAVLGLPLGAADARGVSAMVNCIGVMPDPATVLSVPGTHLHDYGKEPRAGRKLGHVTVLADDGALLDARLADVLGVVAAADPSLP